MTGIWSSTNKSMVETILHDVENVCAPYCQCGDLHIHGFSHLRRVAWTAGRLAVMSGANVESCIVAGFLHDCARTNDGDGSGHARDSAILADSILKSHFPHLNRAEICECIAEHADGKTTSHLLTGCVWDADRLDLVRLGLNVNPELMSTQYARSMAESGILCSQLVKTTKLNFQLNFIHFLDQNHLIKGMAYELIKHTTSSSDLRIYTSSGNLPCSILKEMGRKSDSLGIGRLNHVKLQMIDEYENLYPEHDQSRYFCLAQAVCSWSGCCYKDIIIPPSMGKSGSRLETKFSRDRVKDGFNELSIVDLSSDGTYELITSTFDGDGRSRHIKLSSIFVDKWSRMFEKYDNTPNRVFTVGWLKFLAVEHMFILLTGNEALKSFISLVSRDSFVHAMMDAQVSQVSVCTDVHDSKLEVILSEIEDREEIQ